MVFPTVQFAVFFPIVLALSWALMRRQRVWKPFMLAASFLFYAAADPMFCIMLAGMILGNQAAAQLIHRSEDARRRKLIVVVAVAADLLTLGVFKYYGFFATEINGAARHGRPRAAAPAGRDRAAGRHQLHHLPGDLLRRRRLPPAHRAGDDGRRRACT